MKKIFSLIAAVLFAGSMMAQAPAGTTLFSEDFSSYAKDAVPSGTVTTATGRVVYGDATVTYTTTDGGSTSKIYEEEIATGKSPEILISKNNGSFTIEGIPSGGAKEITVSYKQNKQKLKVEATTTGYTGSKEEKPANVGTNSFDITVADGAAATFDLVFTCTGTSNVRVDDIAVTVKTAGEGGGTPQEDTWTVAGSSEVAFGKTWDPTYAANDMAKQTDGTFKWEKTGLELAAGAIEFKVIKNHDSSWGVAYPAQNYNLAIDAAGIYTITITFEPENENKVSATATKTGEAVVLPTIKLNGNFSGEWAKTDAFAVADDKKTASLKLNLTEGTFEFGVDVDGGWSANAANLTRENPSTSGVNPTSGNNMHITADVAGEYVFTWTFEGNVLAVTFPALPAAPISLTDFIANKPTEAVTLKDLTVIFASGSNTYVIDADGVALVIYDKNKTYYDGTLTAGKVLSGQKATYTVYNNQDEIIPTNAATVKDGKAPEAEARTEVPTTADVNKYLSFKNVEAKVKDSKYYIFDGAVLLYGATGSLKPTEDGKYDLEGLFINFKGNQLELIVTAIEKSSVDPGDEVELNITKGVMFTDAVEEEGWWQVRAMNDHYFISLSNAGEVAAVAGTYTAAQLDEDYSYVNDLTEEIGEDGYTDITFTAGSVTVAVAQDGKVSFVGTLTGSDGKTYKINIVYADPKPETTVNFTAEGEIEDYIESMGGFVVGALKDNVYVQVFINSDQIAGEYTVEDLDLQYSYIQLGEGEYAEIYSATIKVVANADGSYTITADVLCYGDVLYKITVTIPGEEPTAIDNATIAGKIRKAIINGNVVIEKDNTLYNVNGAIVR